MALTLSACTICPPKPAQVIDIPDEYLVDTGDLKKIDSTVNLETLSITIDDNYKKYHTLREQLNSIRKFQSRIKNDSNPTEK